MLSTEFPQHTVDESESAASEQDESSQQDVSSSQFTTASSGESSFSLTREETRKVIRSKLVVFAVICVAAIIVGLLTFKFVQDEEIAKFEAAVSLFYLFRYLCLSRVPLSNCRL